MWKILAPAKLNLYLEVLGPRDDDFHALETLMVPVRIFDQLSWRDNKTPTASHAPALRIRNLLPNTSSLGEETDNLILRAARVLADAANVAPRGQFELIKRIPVQAGMGGGSSDAAAALVLANRAWNLGFSYAQLQPLAAQVGSDVPFFLSRYFHSAGAAICRGRGERVEPVGSMPKLHFVVAQPNIGLSTAEVFGQLGVAEITSAKTTNAQTAGKRRADASHAQLSELVATLQRGAVGQSGHQMTNRLETAATRMAPWLGQLRATFSTLGCVGQLMTGSGSAYVGVMRSAIQAQRAARFVAAQELRLSSPKIGHVFATSSC
ncbi:MAG: 4-(cytidine 5'-diphospho)-2-C-methyl-D-erythritol kinase [Pseudomonadales bacterium]